MRRLVLEYMVAALLLDDVYRLELDETVRDENYGPMSSLYRARALW